MSTARPGRLADAAASLACAAEAWAGERGVRLDDVVCGTERLLVEAVTRAPGRAVDVEADR